MPPAYKNYLFFEGNVRPQTTWKTFFLFTHSGVMLFKMVIFVFGLAYLPLTIIELATMPIIMAEMIAFDILILIPRVLIFLCDKRTWDGNEFESTVSVWISSGSRLHYRVLGKFMTKNQLFADHKIFTPKPTCGGFGLRGMTADEFEIFYEYCGQLDKVDPEAIKAIFSCELMNSLDERIRNKYGMMTLPITTPASPAPAPAFSPSFVPSPGGLVSQQPSPINNPPPVHAPGSMYSPGSIYTPPPPHKPMVPPQQTPQQGRPVRQEQGLAPKQDPRPVRQEQGLAPRQGVSPTAPAEIYTPNKDNLATTFIPMWSVDFGSIKTPMPRKDSFGGLMMWRGPFAEEPSVIHNPFAHAVPYTNGTLVWKPSALSIHPGPNGQVGWLDFLTPMAGNYRINCQVQGIDRPEGGHIPLTETRLFVNGECHWQVVVEGKGAPGVLDLPVLQLPQGCRISFGLGLPNGCHGYGWCSTELAIAISRF